MTRAIALFALPLFVASCGDMGREPAVVSLEARGHATATFVDGSYTITLHRADVAFGPAYFCATAATSTELCETAVLETLSAHPIDALDGAIQPLGELRGVTGEIRSIQYDLGLAFLLAAPKPTALSDSIDGHSVVLEGTATDGVTTFDFAVDVDVTAELSGTTAFVGTRTNAAIPARGATLTLDVDATPWLVGLDWAGLASVPHAPGAPVVVMPGTADYDAILRGITANAPVEFVWSGVP